MTGYTLILSLFNVGPRAVLPCHFFKIDVNNGPPDLTNAAGTFAHSWKSNEMNTSDRQEEAIYLIAVADIYFGSALIQNCG